MRPDVCASHVIAGLYYGRALAAIGKVDEARTAYDQFFAAWKDADATVPLLVEAKREYARLMPQHDIAQLITAAAVIGDPMYRPSRARTRAFTGPDERA